ncbi:hypothetical protein SUDANB95_07288 [Actinosynnema sp. ALI-1.44]
MKQRDDGKSDDGNRSPLSAVLPPPTANRRPPHHHVAKLGRVKALKLGVVVVAVGMVLVGCGSEWTGELKFEVTRIAPAREGVGGTKQPYVIMKLDQEQPDGLPKMDTAGADADQFPADIKVGDKVVCDFRRWDDNGLDGVDPKQEVGPCRRR